MQIERNLRLIRTFEVARRLLFWLPVFFLFFASHVSLEHVLLLEAVYYVATVVLEVPSGWFSDRIGRRPTLLIAMVAQTAGCAIFTFTSSLAPFLVSQVLFAASSAFVSGTNYALLYDSLREVGREDEIGEQTAILVSRGFLALAASSLIGGVLGGFDLRLAFAATGIAGLVALGTAWAMQEPTRTTAELKASGIVLSISKLRDKALLWVFLFSVAMTILDHVPYEFLQPYVGFLELDLFAGGEATTPAVSGVIFAVMMLLSAGSATRSMALSARFGPAKALLFCMVLQSTIICAMALFLHPLVLLLICLRSVPMGLSTPITNAIIQPRIDSGVRATYLSVQSLAGSMAYAGTLFIASQAVDVAQLDVETMGLVIGTYAVGAGICIVSLAPLRRWLRSK